MPMNTAMKLASVISIISSRSSARSIEASVKKVSGKPFRCCQAITSLSTILIAFLLPIRLSSTMKTIRCPVSLIASSSAITWAAVLSRGRRPKVTMMSQNSHWNGQPRENCRLPKAYRSILSGPNRGTGTQVMSVLSDCS